MKLIIYTVIAIVGVYAAFAWYANASDGPAEELMVACAEGNFNACDELWTVAPDDTYAHFADTCGGRNEPGQGWCVDYYHNMVVTDEGIFTEEHQWEWAGHPVDLLFLANARYGHYSLWDVPDDELIMMGGMVCAELEGGMTFDGLANFVMEEGLDPQLIGSVVGAAINAYCPEYADFAN